MDNKVIDCILAGVAGIALTVGGFFVGRAVKKGHGKKSVKSMLEEIGLDKYNTEGKKLALGAINKGIAMPYVKIKSFDEIKNLSKEEITSIQSLCLAIIAKNELAEQPQPQETKEGE